MIPMLCSRKRRRKMAFWPKFWKLPMSLLILGILSTAFYVICLHQGDLTQYSVKPKQNSCIEHMRLTVPIVREITVPIVRETTVSDVRETSTTVSPLKWKSNPNDYPTEGYIRAERLRAKCAMNASLIKPKRVRGSYDPQHNVFYCPLCKVASTFWTRFFIMMKQNQEGRSLETPFDVPIYEAPPSSQVIDIESQRVIPGNYSTADSFRFIVVRNPFGLLFSCFVDKLVGPNHYMWQLFGAPAVNLSRGFVNTSCGDDVTFEEFLKYVVYLHKRNKHAVNCHVAKFDSCFPCATNYTFIVKMETLKDDTFHILAKLNQTSTLNIFKEKFSEVHAYDAIEDSVNGPFNWREGITKCITWYEALQRIWRKLQIRGVIGNLRFPLTKPEAEVIGRDNFIDLLKAARLKTPSSGTSWQKKQAFSEAYATVAENVLDALRHIFDDEFELFDYDNSPASIVGHDQIRQFYGFLNYTTILEELPAPL